VRPPPYPDSGVKSPGCSSCRTLPPGLAAAGAAPGRRLALDRLRVGVLRRPQVAMRAHLDGNAGRRLHNWRIAELRVIRVAAGATRAKLRRTYVVLKVLAGRDRPLEYLVEDLVRRQLLVVELQAPVSSPVLRPDELPASGLRQKANHGQQLLGGECHASNHGLSQGKRHRFDVVVSLRRCHFGCKSLPATATHCTNPQEGFLMPNKRGSPCEAPLLGSFVSAPRSPCEASNYWTSLTLPSLKVTFMPL
jgi:hypothetical protein